MSMEEGLISPSGDRNNWDQIRRQGWGIVDYGAKQTVQFYWYSKQHPGKSRDQGMPIFEKKIYIKIFEPGDRLNEIDREATENDKAYYTHEWKLFCENRVQVPEGTPVEHLFPADPHIADQLKAYGVHTIQQLARLSGHGIGTIGMGAQTWVNLANDYMDKARKGVDFHQIERMKQEHSRELNVLRRDNAALMDRVSKLEAYIQTTQSHLIAGMPQAESVPRPMVGGSVPLVRQPMPTPNAKPWTEAPEGFFQDDDYQTQQINEKNLEMNQPKVTKRVRRT